MKRSVISLILTMTLIGALFSGCGSDGNSHAFTSPLAGESEATAHGENTASTDADSDSLHEPEPDTANMQVSAQGADPANGDTVSDPTVFNFETKTVMLNSGYEMPILGLGTFRLSDSVCDNSVYHTLLDGYRLIDTARIYCNETVVSRGIRRSGVPREEIFITTKIWTDDFGNAASAIDASLERLGVEYIDLMLLHHEGLDDEAAYLAMEDAVRAGKLRSIGVSNFYQDDFDRLMQVATIPPAVVQNETHPYHQSADMKEYLAQYGTVMESWFPLGGRGNTQVLFADETIVEIAEAHGKTSAQVILRWHLQAGNIVIPGSSNPDHILENYEIFDFELTVEEMQRLTALDQQQRFASY